MNIMIVNNEEAVLSLLRQCFASELPGALIRSFNTADECLRAVSRQKPDLIISEYVLPDMNGLELLDALNKAKRAIPVIMLTGYGDEEIILRALKKGARDCLVKSVPALNFIPELIKRIIHEQDLKKALLDLEKRFKDFTENMFNWVWEIDAKGKYVYSNFTVEDILGYRPDELVGRVYQDFIPPGDKKNFFTLLRLVRDTRQPLSCFEHGLLHKDGHIVDIETNAAPIYSDDMGFLGYRGIHRDITERKRAEEQIHLLTRDLFKAHEHERQMISRELHDRIAQELSSLKIGIETLFDASGVNVPDKITGRMLDLSHMLKQTILSVRDLSYNLRPPDLDQLGLPRTLYNYCKDVEKRSGLTIDFNAAGLDNIEFDPVLEINLYRLVQEGLNNIVKHAVASRVIVRLIASFPNVILRIEDDGNGFNVEERLNKLLDEKRMGLRSMEERVALLNGNMTLKSAIGEGTRILIEAPLKMRLSTD
jgi:PAS domain S-box-containing protein